MKNRQDRWLEHVKSLLIIFLSLSAIYLLSRTSPTGTLGFGWLDSLSNLIPAAAEPIIAPTDAQSGLVRPVRLVVSSGAGGRHGLQYDQESVDARFGGVLLNLFSDALTGVEAGRSISADAWQTALASKSQPVVYLDLLGSVPGQYLPSWLGGRAGTAALTGEVRRLFLTTDRMDSVFLYYINETDGSYYACSTSTDLAIRLTEASASFTPNGAFFAFEDPEQYATLAPYTLILPETPHPTVYTASNPIPVGSFDQIAFIQALSFHPQTAGEELEELNMREGTDTLRITATGFVTYYSASAEDPRYPVAGQSVLTMVDAAWSLLEQAAGTLAGDGDIYLSSVKEEAGGTALYFSYQLDGALVHVGRDGYAARFLIQEGRISTYSLQIRRYVSTGTDSIILPEPQAIAAMAAKDVAGRELLLCYQDQRSELVAAGWVAI